MLGEPPVLLHGVMSLTDNDDPPPATGGSAIKAVEVLMEQGVPEERIIFVNLVGYPVFSVRIVLNNSLNCVDCFPRGSHYLYIQVSST